MRDHFAAKEKKQNETRLELKYCEHCGGLWLRECDSGEVYCPACRPLVAQLPAPTRRRVRPLLPVHDDVVPDEDYDFEEGLFFDEDDYDDGDLDGVGGAA